MPPNSIEVLQKLCIGCASGPRPWLNTIYICLISSYNVSLSPLEHVDTSWPTLAFASNFPFDYADLRETPCLLTLFIGVMRRALLQFTSWRSDKSENFSKTWLEITLVPYGEPHSGRKETMTTCLLSKYFLRFSY